MECRWLSPETLLHDCHCMYVGEGEERDYEEEGDKLEHQHHVKDRDGDEFWNEILVYLHLVHLPSDPAEAEQIHRWLKCFFLMNNVLWHWNGSRPPLLVILSLEVQSRIVKDAHNESGHHGRDPTYQKIHNSYWWPNQFVFIAEYC